MPIATRKRGRPSRDCQATLDEKALMAKLLLVERTPLSWLANSFGVHHSTVYQWTRDVCASDHQLADVLRPLAEARGLLSRSGAA